MAGRPRTAYFECFLDQRPTQSARYCRSQHHGPRDHRTHAFNEICPLKNEWQTYSLKARPGYSNAVCYLFLSTRGICRGLNRQCQIRAKVEESDGNERKRQTILNAQNSRLAFLECLACKLRFILQLSPVPSDEHGENRDELYITESTEKDQSIPCIGGERSLLSTNA